MTKYTEIMQKRLGKYSFGLGDRFGEEGRAQLKAILMMQEKGIDVTPVWNKSHREHKTTGTSPGSVKKEADSAVNQLEYNGSYFIDADHIGMDTVENHIPVSDFFTIDVAGYIGQKATEEEIESFSQFFKKYSAGTQIPGMENKLQISETELREMQNNFLYAMKKAGEIYRFIKSNKSGGFHTEVSIDEVKEPQTPSELFFILAALAYNKVPVNTIAPKFTGEFNKGVDYRGDLNQFAKEFEEDLLVLNFSVKEFGLPQDLKMSIHSGSDKFSIYPIMRKIIKKHKAGLHVKTAGTTWLEEAIGLAESEGEGFEFTKEIYAEALTRYEELTSKYTSVLSIDRSKLPKVDAFTSGKDLANALRHDPHNSAYDPNLRQLMHCAYKIAAEKADSFYPLLQKYREQIENNVTQNLYERHLKPLFLS